MQRVSILNKATAHRAKYLGALGEAIAPFYLERGRFESIQNLNDEQRNHPFADLLATREGTTYLISVKTRNKFEARSGNLNARYKLHERKGHTELIAQLSLKHGAVPAWLAIQIDGDCLSVYFGTVEQLEGNKGIPLLADCLPRYECLADHEQHGLDIKHLLNTYETRGPASHAARNDAHPPVSGRIFLHLFSKGWQRFGPFEWLCFQDSPRAIVDEAGKTIALWDGHAWRTSEPKFDKVAWATPTITIGPHRPGVT